MSILSKPSSAFSTSLFYITLGTLIDIWTIVSWFFYPPESDGGKFFLVGSMLTGFALLVIGLLLGQIGRAARHAELPPSEVTPAVSNAIQNAAAHPPAVVANGAMPQGNIPVATANPSVPATPPIQSTVPLDRR